MSRDLAESWLYRRLRTFPALLPLGGRIHPMLSPPSSAPPFAIYTRRSTGNEPLLYGQLPQQLAVFSFSVFASTYESVKAYAAAVRYNLDGFVGFSGGADILGVQITSEADTLVSAADGELLPYYGVEMTIEIRIRAIRT